jgi:PEP-CTERM motif-containing protein
MQNRMQNRKKRPALRLLIAASLSLGAASATATPLYYSFQGQVIYSNASDYALGRPISYVFLVDQAIDGYSLDGAGNVQPIGDDIEAVDFFSLSFYASYVGGDAFTSDNPMSSIRQSCFCGIDQVHYDEVFSALRGSNGDLSGFDNLDIWSYGTRFSDWTVGQNLLAENFVSNGPGALNTSYSSSMILTAITEENPMPASVPEPSILALFGMGLVGAVLVSKSRRSTRSR